MNPPPDVAERAETPDRSPISSPTTRRVALGRSLTRLHARLRTEGGSPPRRGAAVALGTFIGCIPVYGLHLMLSTVLARLLGLSRIVTYLAAHVNNPLTAPLLLYVEQGLGHWLLSGRWPSLSLERVAAAGVLELGRDLAVGSVALGLGLGVLFGLGAWAVAARRRPDPFAALAAAAAEPYLAAGVVHWEWVRGKLRYDPVYRGLLESGLLPRPGRLYDLGCGRGLLLSLLATAADGAPEADGAAVSGAAAVAPPMELHGIERRPGLVAAARLALGRRAEVVAADLAGYPLARCEVVVLLDVLHYLPSPEQEALLARAAAALAPGGLLLMREADAAAGWRFSLTRAAERLCALARGHLRQRFAYRTLDGWRAVLEGLGLAVESRPMSAGTPYGNVLLVARKAESL